MCGNKFTPRTSLITYCSPDCGYKLSMKRLDKKKRSDKIVEAADTKKKKLELLTHSEWQKLLQAQVNKIVRNIDQNFPCISSNRFRGQKQAGHYFSVGSNNSLRFNLFNMWGQSVRDNMYLSANLIHYRENLIKAFGHTICEDLIFSLPLQFPYLKLSITEIKEKIDICKEIISGQRKGLWVAIGNYDRVSIRTELNKKIGIYL